MRVLHICDQYHRGGLGNLILDLHRNSEHEHEAFGFAGIGAMKSEFVDSGMTVWDDWPSADERFDVWVSHTAGSWSSDGIVNVGVSRGVPVVEHMVSNGPTKTNGEMLSGFIAPNKSISLKRHIGIKNAVCLYDPVDTKGMPTRNLMSMWIGKAGRVVVEKAPDVFASIAELFPKREFILIGGGSMEDRLRESGPRNLTITGMLSQTAALNAMTSLYLYVYPTRDDSYGRTIAQAMCMGIPVIYQSDSPVSETVAGYGVGCRTLDDFIMAVGAYLDNPNNMEKMAMDAIGYARTTYGAAAFKAWDEYIGRFSGD